MKALIAGLLLTRVVFPVLAEGPGVVLSNREDEDFYYVLDPPELAAFDPSGSIFPTVVYDYFGADQPGQFEALPPGGTRRYDDLAEGPHLLVGFFVVPGQREYPVRVLRLQVGMGLEERYYDIYREPAFVSVRAGRGRLAAFAPIPPPVVPEPPAGEPPAAAAGAGLAGAAAAPAVVTPGAAPAGVAPGLRIDNSYGDWEGVPVLASFASGYRPESFSRERLAAQLEVLPISQARHWGDGGTALSEIRIVESEEAFYLYVSTYATIGDGLSLFLYLHGPQEGDEGNRLTLEMVPARTAEPGLVVLWERDAEPVAVGSLASGGFFLEAEVPKENLLPYLSSVPGLSYFDITSCYFDRKELDYEEFYFASPSFAAIPALAALD